MTSDLKEQLIDLVFSKEGLLGRLLEEYEERIGQKEMSMQVLRSYVEEKIALIEAGTGIGKSLAYLVPAIYWALKHQQKTVISTHTIALQEQLLLKDIPFILKAMDVDLKAVLVKGMGNYLCLRKLQELQDQPLLFSSEESKEVQQIEKWSEKTKGGSRSEAPFTIHPSTWEKVSAESDACSNVNCSHYQDCFFFKARKEANDAQLLIVNHHLLIADLIRKGASDAKEEKTILPSYERLILDEAHHLEQVALESFAESLDRVSLLRLLGRISSELHPEKSRLFLIRQEFNSIPATVQHKLDVALPVQKKECAASIEKAFSEMTHFVEDLLELKMEGGRESKRRITLEMMDHNYWQTSLQVTFKQLSSELKGLAQALLGLESDLDVAKESKGTEKLASHALEIHSIANRLEEKAGSIDHFFDRKEEEKRVRWIEVNGSNVVLVDAQLDISTLFREHLFKPLSSATLCSATLSANRSFTFLKERLGLAKAEKGLEISEEIYDSPFDYKERTLLVVPTDLPPPSDPQFTTAIIPAIQSAIEASRGNAFVLFTSYDMLENCYEKVVQKNSSERFSFLKQGQLSRHLLVEEFKKTEGSVLFATNSFWEGIDVPGEALRCVIIVKLPFQVPSEPLYQAYTEALEREGKNPFFDYAVPQAVIKFKQGFGRLMRKKNDRGCIVCLDNRLAKKSYGKIFLTSLPASRTCLLPQAKAWDEMRAFYKRVQ